MPPLTRAWHLCLLSYVVASVLYTTSLLFVHLFGASLKTLGPGVSLKTPLRLGKDTWDFSKLTNAGTSEGVQELAPLVEDSGMLALESDLLDLGIWRRPNSTAFYRTTTQGEALLLDEDLILSKAFATSMNPSKIIPYFHKASERFRQDDVTITSIITSDRLDVLVRLVEKYRGPISVAFHVKNTTNEIQLVLDRLGQAHAASEFMSRFVDVHLVIDSFDRQFNTWRNIARLFSRTNFILMLDIDFFPCTDFRDTLNKNPWVRRQLQTGLAAMVLPAFEYTNFEEGKNYSNFPAKKPELLKLVKAKKVDIFHAVWKPGHNSTDYAQFYSASPGEVYEVKEYQSAYEPYVIFKKNGPPWCEERFVGYGGNKAACLFEMFLSGMKYYVLADHFLIHQNHLYEEKARRSERKYNRKVYASFKEEVCFRYLRSYRDAGVLNTTRARNAISECKRLKSIRISAPQLLGG